MNGNYPTRTCVEIELPPQTNIVVSLIATDRVQRGVNVRVESRSTWASCIVGPYRQIENVNFDRASSTEHFTIAVKEVKTLSTTTSTFNVTSGN